jgi:hypothetical protein
LPAVTELEIDPELLCAEASRSTILQFWSSAAKAGEATAKAIAAANAKRADRQDMVSSLIGSVGWRWTGRVLGHFHRRSASLN